MSWSYTLHEQLRQDRHWLRFVLVASGSGCPDKACSSTARGNSLILQSCYFDLEAAAVPAVVVRQSHETLEMHLCHPCPRRLDFSVKTPTVLSVGSACVASVRRLQEQLPTCQSPQSWVPQKHPRELDQWMKLRQHRLLHLILHPMLGPKQSAIPGIRIA